MIPDLIPCFPRCYRHSGESVGRERAGKLGTSGRGVNPNLWKFLERLTDGGVLVLDLSAFRSVAIGGGEIGARNGRGGTY